MNQFLAKKLLRVGRGSKRLKSVTSLTSEHAQNKIALGHRGGEIKVS